MTFESLLPASASEAERAVEGAISRAADIPVPTRESWSAADCPVELLPWLAWGLSVDDWDADWSEQIKRARVAAAIAIQRVKGTAKSVRDVVGVFGGSVAIREWWQQSPPGEPHTFDLILNLNQDGAPASAAFVDRVIAEVQRTKPARSHFTFTQGISGGAAVGVAAYVRPVIYARLNCSAN